MSPLHTSKRLREAGLALAALLLVVVSLVQLFPLAVPRFFGVLTLAPLCKTPNPQTCGTVQLFDSFVQWVWNVPQAKTVFKGAAVQVPWTMFDISDGTDLTGSFDFRTLDANLGLIHNCQGYNFGAGTGAAGCGAPQIALLVAWVTGAGSNINFNTPAYVMNPTWQATVGAARPTPCANCANMTGNQWNSGTVTTNGTTTIAGTGTNFQTSWAAGTPIVIGPLGGAGGTRYTIASCTSTTACTLQQTASALVNTNWIVGSPFGVNFTGVAGVSLSPQDCTGGCNYDVTSGMLDSSAEPVPYYPTFQIAVFRALTRLITHFSPDCATNPGSALLNDCDGPNGGKALAGAIPYIRYTGGSGPENYPVCAGQWPFTGAPFTNAEDQWVLHAGNNYLLNFFTLGRDLIARHHAGYFIDVNMHQWLTNNNAADAQAAIAASLGMAIGNNGFQTSDMTSYTAGTACAGDWCANADTYRTQVLAVQGQPFALSCPNGGCPVGPMGSILNFAHQRGVTIWENQQSDTFLAVVDTFAHLPTGTGSGANCPSCSYTSADFDAAGGLGGSQFQWLQAMNTYFAVGKGPL